ncbi:MAG: response regulator transcription factor [Flavobacteriales bacterium]|nr:response regulator transcription factor [Flavobacteriales bacterium]
MLKENIQSAGYTVDVVSDGEATLNRIAQGAYDLYLMDIMMPKLDGITVVERIRKDDPSTPIIFLSARAMDQDVLDGFKAGADDYVSKPFNVDELLWRVHVQLKRHGLEHAEALEEVDSVALGATMYHLHERLLVNGDLKTRFSKRENEIFKLLVQRKGKVTDRAFILSAIWHRTDEYVSKSLDVHLTHIRKYLKAHPQIQIENIHGLGYQLDVDHG